MNTNAVLALIAVIGASMAAHAESVTYEFTGTGAFCPLDANGGPECESGVAFTGLVTITVLAPFPSGPGAFVGDTAAGDPFGWVESDFIIRWDSNTFSPEPTPGEPTNFSPRGDTLVLNDDVAHFGPVDALQTAEVHSSITAAREYLSMAVITRRTSDTSWLDDLSFDLTVGLAPVVSGGSPIANVNSIGFANHSFNTATGGDWRGYIGEFALTSLIPRLAVAIDVKPGSSPNSINPRNKGVIPVAILGSGEFDATQVDSSTVHFAPGDASPVRDGRVTNVNGDGYSDMLFHFRAQATGITCGNNSVSLTGKTFSGESFAGSDSIRTVGCKKQEGSL